MSDDNHSGPKNGLDFGLSEWRAVSEVEKALAPRGLPVSNSGELTRILNLPRRPVLQGGTQVAENVIEHEMRKYSLGVPSGQCGCAKISNQVRLGNRTCITRFKWEQAWMLYEASAVGGLIANVPVGAGKTLANVLVLLALRDYAVSQRSDCPLALLLVPPSLIGQFETDYQLIAEHFRVPGVVIHKPGRQTWKREPKQSPYPGFNEPVLHVLPYSKLSAPESSEWIERLAPSAVIADEVDALKDMASSRTMRVMRYFERHETTTKFCGWTGSLTDNSIREMAHLACLALRNGSPLPTKKQVIEEWSGCLDAVPNPSPPGALIRLLEPGEGTHQLRRAFRRRLSETPGFIIIEGRQKITTRDGRDVRVDVRERKISHVPPKVVEALEKVRKSVRPDTMVGGIADDILVEKLEQARCAREVASGMLLRWIYPKGEPDWLKKEWFRLRKDYFAELRAEVLKGEPLRDSKKLCENAARRYWGDLPKSHDLPEWACNTWPAWRDIEDKVQPEPKADCLDYFLVDDAAKFAYEHATGQCAECVQRGRGAVIWYAMREFAACVQRRAKEIYGLQLPVYGEGSGEAIVEQENGKRTIIASLKSHGRGRNGLQFMFHHQLVAQSPANARMWQQLLGRLHRRDQDADTVITEIYLHTEELEASFDQALRRGEYVEAVMGEKQKLLDGWDRDDGEFDD